MNVRTPFVANVGSVDVPPWMPLTRGSSCHGRHLTRSFRTRALRARWAPALSPVSIVRLRAVLRSAVCLSPRSLLLRLMSTSFPSAETAEAIPDRGIRLVHDERE